MVYITAKTPGGQLQQFEQTMRAIGYTRIPRAMQFAVNGVAIDAAKRTSSAIGASLQDPTTWSKNAFIAIKGDLKAASDLRKVGSSIKVKDQQSVVFKYLLDESENAIEVRRPGDVGAASAYVLVPNWPAINQRSNVKRTAAGNLPRGAIAKLIEGRGTPNGTFWGQPKGFGQQGLLGLWSRPKRKWDTSQHKMVNQGMPRLLLAAKEQTRHKAKLTPAINKVAVEALETLAGRLDAEIASELGRRSGLASAKARGF